MRTPTLLTSSARMFSEVSRHGWLELEQGDVIFKAIGIQADACGEASSCNPVVLGFGLGFASCCDFLFCFLI